MAKFFETKSFHKKKLIWDKKLSESGFVDVELVTHQRSYPSPVSKQDFYNLIGCRLNEDKNMSERDRFIMIRVAEGMKQKDILIDLNQNNFEVCNRITITRVVTRYLNRWGIEPVKERKTK